MSATTARVVLDEVERRDLDGDALLARCGLTRRTLFNPVARLPREEVLRFARAAQALADDPLLHVAATANTAIGAFGLTDYVLSSAPTVGLGFRRVLRLFHLVNPWLGFDIDEGSDAITIRALPVMVVASDPIEVECTLLAVAVRARQLAGGERGPLWVTFAHARSASEGARLRAMFSCPVRSGATASEVALDPLSWRAPSTLRNPPLAEVLWSVARKMAAELRLSGDLDRVGRALAAGILAERFDIESVARRLGMSGRTLQRQLRRLGTSYTDMLDTVRRRMAIDALRGGRHSVTEIAMNLGFSETSAFSRAFRRWTGRSPSSYRVVEAGVTPWERD